MANIVQKDVQWTRTYVAYREFGASSLFGEPCLTGLTMPQSELLSLSQLYDVLKSQHDVEDEMPEGLWDYPSKMSKWYSEYSKRRRQKLGGDKKKKDSMYSSTFKDDKAAEAKALRRYTEGGLENKNTDWAVEYMRKHKK